MSLADRTQTVAVVIPWDVEVTCPAECPPVVVVQGNEESDCSGGDDPGAPGGTGGDPGDGFGGGTSGGSGDGGTSGGSGDGGGLPGDLP
jgi:hypothetical protein